jgi:hypothetical protein
MTLKSSTTARFFKSAPYDYDRGYLIGVSFVGSLLKHNEVDTDAEILLSGGLTSGALLTNFQSLTCQVINPLDPTSSGIEELLDD